MRYFRLRLTDPADKTLFETDFLTDQFEFFVRQLVSALVYRGLLHPGEQYDARVIPRIDTHPDFQRPTTVKGTDIADDGQGFMDLLFVGAKPPLEQVTYLTIQIRSAEANVAYRFDLDIYSLLRHLLASIAQVLLDEGTLEPRSIFRAYLSAHDKGRPRVDPIAVVKKAAAAAAPPRPEDIGDVPISVEETRPGVTPAQDIEPVEIVIESVEDLIKPQARSMAAYADVEIQGQVSEKCLPIFVRRGAMEQARKAAHVGAKAEEEVGGFLLGNVWRDPDTQRLFVDITEVVEADQARGTYVSIHFDYNAWRQVLDRIDRDFPDKFLLGWYHTHLISQAVVLPTGKTENEYIAEYVPFFSAPDLFIQRNFFPDPWHVALLMDLRCKRDVFFAWQDGDIQAATGYYLYGA